MISQASSVSAPPLILGSTSIYRRQLLEKLKIPFTTVSPTCDESEIKINLEKDKIKKSEWAQLLSEAKSHSISQEGVIITSDQTALFEDEILGKPKNFDKAFSQLKKMQGKTHQLITAVTIRYIKKITTHVQTDQMTMRSLSDQDIINYLRLDQPFDAAGSYKIENSGISLFARIECADFTGIQGLPMVWVTNRLKEFNYEFYQK